MLDNDITDWTELREFKGVDLTSSFVLSWNFNGEMLRLDIDVCLTPQHALYDPPRPSEDACILPAVIEFPFCQRLTAMGREANSTEIADLIAALLHGRISNLQRIADGVYRIEGDFGRAEIYSERPLLRLRGRYDE